MVPSTLKVNLSGGLQSGRVHVWHSDARRQFAEETEIRPCASAFTVTLGGNSIYSLTTTSGQRKGVAPHPIPAAKRFPLPYRDDFESYRPGQSPRYFSDQKGTFEVWDEPGHGKCLKQIVPEEGILWVYMRKVPKPFTVIGDPKWADYALSADVRVAGGDVELGGRFGSEDKRPPARTNSPTAGSWPRTEPGS